MNSLLEVESAADELGEVLALDLGGSKLALALVSRQGELLSHSRKPTSEVATGEALVAWVRDEVRGWEAAPRALGISSGGPLDDQEGIITRWPRMEHLWDFPLCRRLGQELPDLQRVQLVNDASAACAGEVVFGAARGLRRALYITISTGVGGGAVVGGMLLRGRRGNAAEFGHTAVAPGGPPCDCGARGCLEALISGSGLYRRVVAAGLLADEEFGWAKLGYWLKERLDVGDAQVRAIWEEGLAGLATGLVNLYNCFVPQAMVLGGGLSVLVQQEEARLLEMVRRRACLMPIQEGVIRFSDNRDTIPLLGVAAVAGGWIGVEP